MKITVKTKEKLLSYFNNSDDIWLRNNYDKEALKDEYSSEDFEYCWTRAMWDDFNFVWGIGGLVGAEEVKMGKEEEQD